MKLMLKIIILISVLIVLCHIVGCGAVYKKIKSDLEAQPIVQSSISQEERQSLLQGDSLPKKFNLHSVPHNSRTQRGTDCGPDSLRMVLNYYDKKCKEGELVKQLDSRGRYGGVSFKQLAEITRKYDLEAYLMSNLNLDILKSFLLNQWPPIVAYKSRRNTGHAVVMVGYDDAKKRLSVHDPNFVKVRQIPYHQFLPVWKQTSNSCLLVVPKGLTKQDIITAVRKYVSLEVR
ncbi:C39 family peptidase [bacterium]|nr:C39 family peptidase [bacterium]